MSLRLRFLHPLFRSFVALCALLPLACFGGASESGQVSVGAFVLEGVNIPNESTWELNRTIRFQFNHAVDPASLGFSSIVIAPQDPGLAGSPVTGSFSLEHGSDGRVVLFRPACPTNDAQDNGGLIPGGFAYRVEIPTVHSGAGQNVLRDTEGRLIESGTSRVLYTPAPPAEPLFLDDSPLPAEVISILWPERLNFFTDPEPMIQVRFDQSIDGRSTNLNTDRVYFEFSDDTLTSNPIPSYVQGNKVPGKWIVIENCSLSGSLVFFQISGILPADRALRLVVEPTFTDIVGQTNQTSWVSARHDTPTLESVYAGALLGWTEFDETVDEISDHFMDSSLLDLEASLTAPMAEARGGFIQASFDYPGQFVGPDDDFVWDEPVGEIRTNGNFVISDSNNRTFTVSNGVLYVDDFLLMAGANLRGRGDNPLIIYAQGKVEIYGKLSVSGNDSHWPTSLNSPGFPEGPVLGECGGGLGGISSFEGLKETLRGKPGDGPFGFVGIGGQGGEGGFQQNGVGSSATETAHLIAGGGAGGGFTRTSNVAIWRQDWISNQRPNGADNNGPDHRHTEWNLWPDGYWRGPVERLDPNDPFHERHRPDLNAYGPAELPVYGAEPGVRGASFKTPLAANYDYDAPPPTAHGVHGMEDERVDLVDPLDSTNASSFDPDWFINEVPDPDPSIQNPRTFDLGHPTNGADGGLAGQPVFSDDGDTRDDFYGTRLNNDGTVTQGELFSGWAGSGGGASGDSQMIRRISTAVPLRDYFPTRPFPPTGSGYYYRKGAPGGGGGGQLQILAIGPVILGSSSSIESNGGIGHGGESTIYTQGQISGSGGGAGGHIVIHSATAIDLSLIDVGNATTATDVFNLNQKTVVEAIGGRRGWSGSWNSRIGSTNTYDGNGDQMVGRGGAGANGLIQFHVPDPNTDYFWNTWSRNGILAFIAPTGAVDTDRLEMILDLYASPKPYALLPFFAAKSQMQSIWLDTGMAFVHRESLGDYPQWSNPMLAFDGVDTTTGAINVSGGEIIDLPDLVTGTTSQASFTLNTISVLDASVRFAGLEHFLRHPMALVGYTVLPNVLDALEAVVIDASYDASADILLLTTDINDGALSAGAVAGEDWSIRPRFFTVRTTGDRDGLPTNAGINIVFQGTDDPENGQILPGAVEWTANMADLDGLRFIRYRVTFDIDATGAGVSPTSPRPEMDYLKIPFVW